MNSGQTCIAPDYVLFVGDSMDEFVDALKRTIVKFYGENPQESSKVESFRPRDQFFVVLRLLGVAMFLNENKNWIFSK